MDDSASTDAGHDKRRKQEARKSSRDEEKREGRKDVRQDGGRDMAAGAISADTVRTSLDSTEFYWARRSVE